MTTHYAEFLREDVRLVLLRLLSEMVAYRANSSVLTMALDSYGHSLSRDQVKTELYWLAEQGALDLNDVGPVLVATLTERGQDIAAGRARVPGIKRPGA
ncbi:ArsR family transcriptional regulator [Pseudomonas capsici]|uniref:VpaChn25_0724 family phage protein n=1 Tax=Pseudomonas capsici TaxID=2810614 RepID=UPI0021F1194E|nr:ArsR family transcriptional regulator [Pseudomonas capsici]MCV4272307.1 ArsR family transcriptional regulator [Pseudomonas capsici]